MLATLKELFNFLIERKKYYLFPILLILFIVGFLVVTGQGSSVTPFIYAIF